MLSELRGTTSKPDSTPIPVPLNAQEFTAFIWPPLSWPQRGPQCKIGSHKAFTSILKVLSTGLQWKAWPIDKGAEGNAELHYPGGFKRFARWAEDGSLPRAFLASVNHLDEAPQLD